MKTGLITISTIALSMVAGGDARLTPQTPIYLASLAKQFTGAAVVLLESKGKLSLDADVRTWFPALPRRETPI